jgi:hypothetical protein
MIAVFLPRILALPARVRVIFRIMWDLTHIW